VRRFDALGELEPPKPMPNGYLRVEAFLTRTGVFPYRRADGSTIREYRPPEEVFAPASLASFDLMPATVEHPPVPGGLLNSSNTHQFQVGAVGNLRRIGDRMKGAIVVTDSKAQAELPARREISLGYVCDLEMSPGISPEGEPYDAIQRNIVGNHCAFTKMARGGPDLRVRMDSADAEMISSEEIDFPPGNTEEAMSVVAKRKIRLDGLEIEVDAAVADAIEQSKARLDSAVAIESARGEKLLAEQKAETGKAVARADAAEAQIKALTAELAAAPAKALATATVRADLENTARGVLGAETKLDTMNDAAIRATVVTKLSGDDMAGKDPVYVAARFDAEMAIYNRTNPALAAARGASTPAPATVRTDSLPAADAAYLAAVTGKATK
jgi:hypothetical protein